MGIGDRAYMRNQRPAREPISATAWVVGVLVGFFILGLIEESTGVGFSSWLILSKGALDPWRWLTYSLVHQDWLHLLGNGLVLWWTGSLVEKEYGRRVFLGVLAAGVLIGAAAWLATGIGETQKLSIDGKLLPWPELVGISAGVYALMLVALLDKLDHQITLLLFFFLPVTLKVRWLLIATALFAILGWGFSELPTRHDWPTWKAAWRDGIAHSAHLGGLLFGWLGYRRLNQSNLSIQDTPRQASSSDADDARSIARDAYAAEENSGGADNEVKSPSNLTKGQARAELDMLLDKISAGGFGSLTVGEKRRLEELSARLR